MLLGHKLILRNAHLLKGRHYSSINPLHNVRVAPLIQRRWLILGGGLLATSTLYFGSTIYLDSKNGEDDRRSIRWQTGTPMVDDFPLTSWQYPSSRIPYALKIKRMDGAQLASNQPIEDRVTFCELDCGPSLKFAAITVLDGHNGPYTAEFLSKALPHTVSTVLANYLGKQLEGDNVLDVASGRILSKEQYSGEAASFRRPVLSPEDIDDALKAAFVKVDDHIVHEMAQTVLGLTKEEYAALQSGASTDASPSKDSTARKFSRAEAVKALEYAHSGACAIMALYDPARRSLKIAQTGDARAVLGRRVPGPSDQRAEDGSEAKVIWETHVLSADHNAKNPSEAARLTALHPNEPELLKNGRTLGWGPSRAFGDASMKWPIAVQKRMKEEYLGSSPREVCKTPPYFTAEPEITTFQVQKGDFMVIATDGLWDCLTSEEVVGLTGWWIEQQNNRVKSVKPKVNELSMEIKRDSIQIRGTGFFEGIFGITDDVNVTPPTVLEPKELPVKFGDDYKDSTVMYPYWRTKKQFINVDEHNVGKHLVRNALGGADQDLRTAILSLKPPRSRSFRDDISVYVVFFE